MKVQEAKAWRDIFLQMTASIMIPLTVAGMGWYYTRWQQNLSDLKTMIDLVSDSNPERQKYGVAMFEYLLKNDKVPVEFVAAQLDYANSSSDPELLTLMETALMKAAQVNTSVGQVFNDAVERLPSRLFVHVTSDDQRACFRSLLASLKDNDKATITVPSVVKGKWDGKQSELRVLKDNDLERAKVLAGLFGGSGLDVKVINLAGVWDGARKVRPNTFELWFADGALPQLCTVPGQASATNGVPAGAVATP